MRRLIPALVAAAALVACSGGDSADTVDAAGGGPTTTAAGTGSTPARATPLTPSSTAPGACPGASVPIEAIEVTTAPGDFDGDGATDEMHAYRYAGAYNLTVTLAAGGGAHFVVRSETNERVFAIGGFDVDKDGDDELWAEIGGGGSLDIASLYVFDECEIKAVTFEGEPAHFPIGSTFIGGSGIECATAGSGDVDLSIFSGSSGDARTFVVESTLVQLEGATLTQVANDVFETDDRASVFSFDCGSLNL